MDEFMGVAAAKVTGVYVKGIAAALSCVAGTFRFDVDPDQVSWRDSRGHHVVFADEVIGVTWSAE